MADTRINDEKWIKDEIHVLYTALYTSIKAHYKLSALFKDFPGSQSNLIVFLKTKERELEELKDKNQNNDIQDNPKLSARVALLIKNQLENLLCGIPESVFQEQSVVDDEGVYIEKNRISDEKLKIIYNNIHKATEELITALTSQLKQYIVEISNETQETEDKKLKEEKFNFFQKTKANLQAFLYRLDEFNLYKDKGCYDANDKIGYLLHIINNNIFYKRDRYFLAKLNEKIEEVSQEVLPHGKNKKIHRIMEMMTKKLKEYLLEAIKADCQRELFIEKQKIAKEQVNKENNSSNSSLSHSSNSSSNSSLRYKKMKSNNEKLSLFLIEELKKRADKENKEEQPPKDDKELDNNKNSNHY